MSGGGKEHVMVNECKPVVADRDTCHTRVSARRGNSGSGVWWQMGRQVGLQEAQE